MGSWDIFRTAAAADDMSKDQCGAVYILAQFVPRELCFIDLGVLHLKAEEGLVRDSILGVWGLTFSPDSSNTDTLLFTKSLCL